MPTVAVTTGQVVTLQSDSMVTTANSVVFIEITRTGAMGYSSDLGILDTSYIFE